MLANPYGPARRAGFGRAAWKRVFATLGERSKTMTTATQSDIFALLGPAVRALATRYDAAMQAANEQAGIAPADLNLLLLARGAEPEAPTRSLLQRQMPYLGGAGLAELLAGAAERGLLAEEPSGSYWLTERGRASLENTFGAVHAALAGYQPLPEARLGRAADLLQRVVEAMLAAPEPAGKFHLLSSRLTDPGAGASAAARLDQYATDLLHFRDDAHQAAWQPLTADGPAWEILTLIWRGEANTLAALQQRLERRRHDPAVIEQALADLRERGWIVPSGEAFEPSLAGRERREQAEETTDRLFYTPWNVLSTTEIDELHELLGQLRDSAPQAEGS